MEERGEEGVGGDAGTRVLIGRGRQPSMQARLRAGEVPGFHCVCMCVIIFESITSMLYL